MTAVAAGIIVPVKLTGNIAFDQLRLELRFANPAAAARLDHVALWPAPK